LSIFTNIYTTIGEESDILEYSWVNLKILIAEIMNSARNRSPE
jgi:hypothetical protein